MSQEQKPSFRLPAKKEDRGTAAIEFALIAPILLTFLLVITEMAIVMFASATLSGATSKAARYGRIGDINIGQAGAGQTSSTLTIAAIKQKIVDRSGGLFKIENLKVSVTAYNNTGSFNYDACNSGTGGGFGAGSCDAGIEDQWVKYQSEYPWPLTPVTAIFFANDQRKTHYVIKDTELVKNEGNLTDFSYVPPSSDPPPTSYDDPPPPSSDAFTTTLDDPFSTEVQPSQESSTEQQSTTSEPEVTSAPASSSAATTTTSSEEGPGGPFIGD